LEVNGEATQNKAKSIVIAALNDIELLVVVLARNAIDQTVFA